MKTITTARVHVELAHGVKLEDVAADLVCLANRLGAPVAGGLQLRAAGGQAHEDPGAMSTRRATEAEHAAKRLGWEPSFGARVRVRIVRNGRNVFQTHWRVGILTRFPSPWDDSLAGCVYAVFDGRARGRFPLHDVFPYLGVLR